MFFMSKKGCELWELKGTLEITSSRLISKTENHPNFLKYISPAFYFYFFRFYLFIFWRRGRRKKDRGRNINMWLPLEHSLLGTWPATQACALTGIQTGNSLVCRPAFNPLSHASQVLIYGINQSVFIFSWFKII